MRCTRMSETRVIRTDVRKDPHLLPCIDQHDRDSIGVSDIVPFLDPMVVPNFILADGLPSDQSLIPLGASGDGNVEGPSADGESRISRNVDDEGNDPRDPLPSMLCLLKESAMLQEHRENYCRGKGASPLPSDALDLYHRPEAERDLVAVVLVKLDALHVPVSGALGLRAVAVGIQFLSHTSESSIPDLRLSSLQPAGTPQIGSGS